jgi:His-Xaa-Ser system protein HxsD
MKRESRSSVFSVETRIYPKEAVLAAANVFSGRALVKIGALSQGRLSVVFSPVPGQSDGGVSEGEFFNELLHHALRLAVAERNQAIREKIVAQALLSAQQPARKTPAPPAQEQKGIDAKLEKEIEKLLKEAESGGYKSDPLGIAVPWEKKKAGKKAK